MGRRELALALAVLWALLTRFLPAANAFHDGGVGACDGCHELHPEQGIPEGSGADDVRWGELLLRGDDASSTCLRCHGERGKPHTVLSEDGSSFHAGGDFYWVTRSYAWMEGGQARVSTGDSHGHNPVAAEYGLLPDGRLSLAPGGDYPASELSCISCHDPHGQEPVQDAGAPAISRRTGSSSPSSPVRAAAGNYRLLGGRGYATAGIVFSNDAPVAVSPVDWSETDQNHVDYGSGMSAWCANCHGALFDGSAAQHPAGTSGVFGERTAAAYGSYLRTGDLSGSWDSSYLALVPFERGVADPAFLDPSDTSGPTAGVSNVMCLTCHRAHASAFASAARWDLSVTFLRDSHPGPGDGGADAQNSYYGRDLSAQFGPYQRSLCNKCHVQD